MVPGLTEREWRAAELRRRDLLAEVERERLLATTVSPGTRPPRYRWRWTFAGALVTVGRRLQGMEPASAAGTTAAIESLGSGR